MAKYILCDLEATGNREQDRVIQLGLMVFDESIDSKPVYISNELNSTNADMMSEAMELHHITPEILTGKKDLHDTEGYKKLCELNLPENIFIAHDAPSDLKMLQKEGFKKTKMNVIDTLKCSRHLFDNLDAHRLQYLRYKLGLYKKEKYLAENLNIQLKAHDAIGDAIVMRILLEKLIDEVKKKFGILSDTEAIDKLIELSNMPALLKKFKFGKYKGQSVEEIACMDYDYIHWMRNNLKLDDDMKYTLDYYL